MKKGRFHVNLEDCHKKYGKKYNFVARKGSVLRLKNRRISAMPSDDGENIMFYFERLFRDEQGNRKISCAQIVFTTEAATSMIRLINHVTNRMNNE